MYLSSLSLADFRSYTDLHVDLEPGPVVFCGRNGQGKTNLVEAVDYLSRLGSHRVAGDQPLVRVGADRAIVRADVVKHGRTARLEVEIHPGRSNKARINDSPLPRAREIVGLVRTVVFSPEDLALVKGDPSRRRRFTDDLLALRTPRLLGVMSDYERVLKQRNTLLKNARASRRRSGPPDDTFESTLEVWDDQLIRSGTELMAARGAALQTLAPYAAKAYASVAEGADRVSLEIGYRPNVGPGGAEAFRAALTERRREELDRGLSLVGPHRDEVDIALVDAHGTTLPVKGYASHGETWSTALALRLGSYELLRDEDEPPVLILDDVFAELDTERRNQLAGLVGDAEQVLVTAAVADDVPTGLRGTSFTVAGGAVTRDDRTAG